ncbi:hypothetical protein Desru_1842 [Desulforamulus ruminis DSM 2154]|uniref:Uncharacterized protein n=1 Tax=Desulforamulus ruminis (strain ATCC 23193 / DSM 2154 / NCIMB 8452 / DL) TaxID=696281 RepID=F6DU28_DESRL|nr:hypothetical protein Desru_1842 [Desulforamulus ruminis DSM 2154]
MILAPWVWSLVTVFFLIGIKIYHPPKSILPITLMGWSSSIFIVSGVLYLDGLMTKSTAFSWEPMLLSLGTFVFCFSLYRWHIKNNQTGKEKPNRKKNRMKAC